MNHNILSHFLIFVSISVEASLGYVSRFPPTSELTIDTPISVLSENGNDATCDGETFSYIDSNGYQSFVSCNNACPGRTESPQYVNLLSNATGYEQACVEKINTDLPPYSQLYASTGDQYAAYFSDTPSCQLSSRNMFQLVGNVTVTLWVWNEIPKGRIWTLFETEGDVIINGSINNGGIFSLSLRERSQPQLAQDVSFTAWIIPVGEWTHIAIQVNRRTLSVFISGLSPTVIDLRAEVKGIITRTYIGNVTASEGTGNSTTGGPPDTAISTARTELTTTASTVTTSRAPSTTSDLPHPPDTSLSTSPTTVLAGSESSSGTIPSVITVSTVTSSDSFTTSTLELTTATSINHNATTTSQRARNISAIPVATGHVDVTTRFVPMTTSPRLSMLSTSTTTPSGTQLPSTGTVTAQSVVPSGGTTKGPSEPAPPGGGFNGGTQAPTLGITRRKREIGNVPGERFIGRLFDLRVYTDTLTNREIEEVYSGTFPALQYQTECRCPGTHPKVNPSDNILCVRNSYNHSSESTSRVNVDFNLPEFISDPGRTWKSKQLPELHITFELGQVFEVMSLSSSFIFYSSSPQTRTRSVLIQAQEETGLAWKTWQMYADDCQQSFGVQPANQQTVSATPSCVLLPADTAVNLTLNLNASALDETQTRFAKSVRIILKYLNVSTSRFGIADIDISGRCHCYGHAQNCNVTKNCSYCVCDTNSFTSGTNCEMCLFGHYRVQDSFYLPCQPCNCHVGGSVMGATCNATGGQCPCRDGGNIMLAGRTCAPHITGVTPNYGPQAGGTTVVVSGGLLNSSSVYIGDNKCNQTERTDTRIVCKTMAENITGQYLISLKYEDGEPITNTSYIFKNKENPIIVKIEPLETFLSGGLVLTISGKYLDSIFEPIMVVSVVDKLVITVQYNTVCSVTNSTTMLCPTPNITLPLNYNGRRKRAANFMSELNNDDLQFNLGFALDGVPTYRNLSESLPAYSVLLVYEDPKIFEFQEENRVKEYKPEDATFLTVKGERLNYGCSIEDYKITIGYNGTCVVTNLATNQVTCRPPVSQPVIDNTIHGPGNSPHVKVQVGNIIVVVGYLKWVSIIPETAGFLAGISIGVILIVAVIIGLIMLFIWFKRREKRKKQEQEDMYLHYLAERGHAGENVYNIPAMRQALMHDIDLELKIRMKECVLHPDRLKLPESEVTLGKGHFGRVLKGELLDENFDNPEPVAVKTLRDGNLSVVAVSEFLEEGLMMKGFNHENVLSLFGVVISDDIPMVVLPYMDLGDLKSYISHPDMSLVVRELLAFGLQIAKGMEYLAYKRFVHRDLAARNCMVNSSKCVKIADFGLSRDIYEKDYYCTSDATRPLPVKWMSIESLEQGVFTSKSDVWSFGVLLWEIVTRGCHPYPDVDNFNMKKYLSNGHRLSKPEYAPDLVFDLMQECWRETPDNRPTFKDLKESLSALLDEKPTKASMDAINIKSSSEFELNHLY